MVALVGGAGSAGVGGAGAFSDFVSASGAGVGAGGRVFSCFTFFFALLFFPSLLALDKIQPQAEGIADSR